MTAIFLFFMSAGVHGEMVTARWGVQGHVQHPDSLTYTSAGNQGTVIAIDLSLLPPKTTIYRARLIFERPGLYGCGFDIVPCDLEAGGAATVIGPKLELVPPALRWFETTQVVRQWHQKQKTKE